MAKSDSLRPLKSALRFALRFLNDEQYVRFKYWSKLKRRLNLKEPRTFNELMQLKKIQERSPLIVQTIDKAAVRDYVRERLGDEYLAQDYGIFTKVDDLLRAEYPLPAVIKATHGCGWNYFCRTEADRNPAVLRPLLEKWMQENYYWMCREWGYREVPPRLLIEEFLSADNGQPPPDYKFFVLGGRVGMVQVDLDRFTGHRRALFDRFWRWLDVAYEKPKAEHPVPAPPNLAKMIEAAEVLAEPFRNTRVDFYDLGSRVVFGEITHYPEGGWGVFDPGEFDEELARLANGKAEIDPRFLAQDQIAPASTR